MKKIFSAKKIVSIVGLSLICTTAAEATPAFARQMDMECMSCHYQNMPKLNSFGREFKMSGFTMTSGKEEMKSTLAGGLGLPETLNMGLVLKARVLSDEKTEKSILGTTTKTEIFDESAFIFGGKIADNVGTSMEVAAGGIFGGKVLFTTEALGGRVGAAYSTTDALGAFAGTEIYTTGLYRPVRQFENRAKTNIFQNMGIGAGEASVVQVYYRGNGLYATVGGYTPTFAQSSRTDTDGYKLMARAAYEFNVASTTMMLGGFYLGGDVGNEITTYNASDLANDIDLADLAALDRTAYGIDFQIENTIADMPLMVTGAYVLKNEYNDYDHTTFTVTNPQDKTGFHLDAQLNLTDKYGVKAAALSHKDDLTANRDYDVYSAGLEYNMRQNVRFCLEYSYTSSDRSDTSTVKYSGSDILFMSMVAF
ncbi:MAG: hypothetical protein QG565_185 [Campylobacterota bacterium]|nr:hypothetical protein [Campylobacterota bacterium]MDQ1268397.1 hypothetical protein [Campylobacterota bacterium]MDQ1337724.1 hypothetical protein [Campylobacterota bacterium]